MTEHAVDFEWFFREEEIFAVFRFQCDEMHAWLCGELSILISFAATKRFAFFRPHGVWSDIAIGVI